MSDLNKILKPRFETILQEKDNIKDELTDISFNIWFNDWI